MSSREGDWFHTGRLLRGLLEGLSSTEGAAHESTASAAPFPEAGVDAFLSHFIVAIRFSSGEAADGLTVLSLPAAVQTVARSSSFRYEGSTADHRARLPIPSGSSLQEEISEADFLVRPPDLFQSGCETVWLQILNLDARADTPVGPVRIILGETFKREYEDVFQPSFGAAQSIGTSGFPARLFFSPSAVIETPLGAFKTRAKALVGASISDFPPVGSIPSLRAPVPLDLVDDVRKARRAQRTELQAAATVVGLAHPIDAALVQGGDTAFDLVEATIAR